MDRLETLLSETLSEQADRAPTGPVPLVGRTRRSRNSIALVAAVVTVMAVAVVVGLVHLSGLPSRSTHSSAPPVSSNLPGGVRFASYGSVSVQVPSGLATRTSPCGPPASNEVVAFDGKPWYCPDATDRLAAEPGIVVWFSSTGQATPYADIPTSPEQVDGHAAQAGYATDQPGLGAGVAGVVMLPDQHTTLGVTAPTQPDVDQVLSSIRIADIDPLGCAANRHSATTTSPGPSDILINADPASAVRCEYSSETDSPVGNRLVGSYLLDQSETNRLTTALNALTPDPCQCVHGGTAAPGHAEVLYFEYSDGSTLRIDGAIGANLDEYTNQTRTVANYSSSITQLLGQLTNEN
jgi:hypothetical protein